MIPPFSISHSRRSLLAPSPFPSPSPSRPPISVSVSVPLPQPPPLPPPSPPSPRNSTSPPPLPHRRIPHPTNRPPGGSPPEMSHSPPPPPLSVHAIAAEPRFSDTRRQPSRWAPPCHTHGHIRTHKKLRQVLALAQDTRQTAQNTHPPWTQHTHTRTAAKCRNGMHILTPPLAPPLKITFRNRQRQGLCYPFFLSSSKRRGNLLARNTRPSVRPSAHPPAAAIGIGIGNPPSPGTRAPHVLKVETCSTVVDVCNRPLSPPPCPHYLANPTHSTHIRPHNKVRSHRSPCGVLRRVSRKQGATSTNASLFFLFFFWGGGVRIVAHTPCFRHPPGGAFF